MLALFHFALKEEGFLFLGTAETVGRHSDLFEPVSKKWRLYRRIGPTRPERVEFPIIAAEEMGGAEPGGAEPPPAPPRSFAEITRRLLLEDFAPAAVLINPNYEILYYHGPCAQYLEFPTGQPTHDLTLMAREGLRTKLRGAVRQAVSENEKVVLPDVSVKRNGSYQPVRVAIKPIHAPKTAEGLLLVTFVELAGGDKAPPLPPAPIEGDAEAKIRQLEHELKATREDLQSTAEEMESSNEELKASNEEVTSMNEELQSTNAELESSKEELQSLNEELSTVNNQLHDNVDELEKANNDMANFLHCTEIATIFLDAAFRIRLFTPPSTRLFNLKATDVGRPLTDIKAQFHDPALLGDAAQVLRELVPREQEVAAANGSWYIRRIMPYRTRDDRIDGVVISFVDITERKRAAEDVIRHLAAIVEGSADAIFSKDLDGTIRTWNRGAERLYGYKGAEVVGRSVALLFPPERGKELAAILDRLKRGETIMQLETERDAKMSGARRSP